MRAKKKLKYEELRIIIRDLIRLKTKNSDDYDEKHIVNIIHKFSLMNICINYSY